MEANENSPWVWACTQIDKLLGKHTDKLWQRYKQKSLVEYTFKIQGVGKSGQVDANGNCTIQVYENGAQRDIKIGRIIAWADGVTPAAPHLAGGSEWAGIFGGPGANIGAIRDFLPNSSGGQMFPQTFEYSGPNSLRFERGEDIFFELRGSTLAQGTNITILVWGFAEPVDSDYE